MNKLSSYFDAHCLRPWSKYADKYSNILSNFGIELNQTFLSIPAESLSSVNKFITGNDFRDSCDIVLDDLSDNESITKKLISLNSMFKDHIPRIFLKTDYLDLFFSTIYLNINKNFYLITHNSDFSAPGTYISKLLEKDTKIIKWYGQNCSITQKQFDQDPILKEKFIPIPIGFANIRGIDLSTPKYNIIPMHSDQRLLRYFSNRAKKFEDKLYGEKWPKVYLDFHHNMDSHNHRLEALISLSGKPFIQIQNEKLLFENYLNYLNEISCIISPHGNGLDCHRTYEALCMNVIPIVKKSSLDALYKTHKLPVVIVDDWSDLDSQFIQKKIKEFKGKIHLFNTHPALTTIYWKEFLDKD
jgi:hypothetical protein